MKGTPYSRTKIMLEEDQHKRQCLNEKLQLAIEEVVDYMVEEKLKELTNK